MNWIRISLSAAAIAALMLVTTTAAAQDEELTEYVPEEEITPFEGKDQGWDGSLQTNATFNFIDNRNVVGQNDGHSILLGLTILSGLDWIRGRHELRTTASVTESLSRTPELAQFVKSDDVANVESIYHYFFIKWLGAFGRFSGQTALFATERHTPEAVTYAIERPDGTVDVDDAPRERLRLSDPFQPLTLNESVGIFAEPVREEAFKLSARVGFGLRQTWAQGVLVIQDDDATEEIEVLDITNPESSVTVLQGGLEGFLGIAGKLNEERVNYEVGATALVPFINNDAQDRSATELTRIGATATAGVAIFEWMSLNYKLRLTRDPQLLDELQVQNNLLLTVNYTLIETAEADEEAEAPEPTEAEEEAAAAKARAEEAEERAREAEERAAALQTELEAARAEEPEEAEAPEEPEAPEAPEAPEEEPEAPEEPEEPEQPE